MKRFMKRFRLAALAHALTRALAAGLALGVVVALGAVVANDAAAQYADGGDAEIHFPVVTLRVGAADLHAEVADTSARRARGLSGRTTLRADAGMLFVFSRPRRPCFWMRNTFIPLDLAYLSADGVIVQTLSLTPLDETPRCAHHAALYGLETNPGWLRQSGAAIGDAVPNLPRPQLPPASQ